jgi:mono/diheme cytochrome c family protein
VQGNYTAMLGTWRAEVLVRRAGQDDVQTTLILPMSEPRVQVSNPVLVSPARFMMGLEVLIMGGLLVVGSRRLGRAQRLAGWAALIGGLAVVTFGVSVATSGFTTAMDPFMGITSPIPADAISVGRGLHIYQANCESCHGRIGAGDGPLSAKVNPPPANLQVHMAAGHSDGQLFDWITNGIVGSAMPPFGNRLSDNDTWDVINYIRTFAAKGQ